MQVLQGGPETLRKTRGAQQHVLAGSQHGLPVPSSTCCVVSAAQCPVLSGMLSHADLSTSVCKGLVCAVCYVLCAVQYRAQAAEKGIPFVDLKNLSLLELQLYLLPVFRWASSGEATGASL